MKAHDTTLLDARTSRPVSLTRMGFGGAPIGNLYRRVSEEGAQGALHAAHACGIRYFDTAPVYGFGRSEERIGVAIERLGRESIVLSSKVGRLLVDCSAAEMAPEPFVDVPHKKVVFDYSYDGVMRGLESSLQRLAVDDIDIVLAHDLDAFTHGTRALSDARIREFFDAGGYRALEELKADGRIAAFGAGVDEWQVCEKLLELAEFDVFLLAGRYTLLEQEALDTFLPMCLARDVGVIVGAPFNSGILATGAVEGARFNYEVAPRPIMDRVRRIEALCRDHDVRLPAAALHFILAHPAVRSVIPGAMSEQEVRQNVALLEQPVPPQLWVDLKAALLLHEEAPVPAV